MSDFYQHNKKTGRGNLPACLSNKLEHHTDAAFPDIVIADIWIFAFHKSGCNFPYHFIIIFDIGSNILYEFI